MKKIMLTVIVLAFTFGGGVSANAQVQWTRNGAPTDVTITGGPWTLEQSGAANGLKSSHYCDANGNQIGNPVLSAWSLIISLRYSALEKAPAATFKWLYRTRAEIPASAQLPPRTRVR